MEKQTFRRPEEIKRTILIAPGRQLTLTRPLVMGILNVTPDSFSDGGKYTSVDDAVGHGLRMVAEGADIIDVGGESTRPGAEPVSAEQEMERVIPVIERLHAQSPVVISVDTYKAAVADAGVAAGAEVINDISALRFDEDMAAVVSLRKVPVVLMHMLGTPRSMQVNPSYGDCVAEIGQFFNERLLYCRKCGIDKTKVILDPGIGFGKRLRDNLEILANLPMFYEFKLPILIGASRKSFIGMLHDKETAAEDRLGGSIAAAVVAVAHGASIVRVHDVAPTVEALKVLVAIGDM